MDKKRKNGYDVLVEGLALHFKTFGNIEQIYQNEGHKTLFDFYIKRHHDLKTLKTLILSKYLPITQEIILQETKSLRSSKYKKLLNISDEDFKEPVYELIRLAYVGLFHKYENFAKNLLDCLVLCNPNTFTSRSELDKFFQESFSFSMVDWHISKSIKRINWICNTIKHNDSYINKSKEIPEEFINHSHDKKLKLSSQDFKRDVDIIIHFYEAFFKVCSQLTILKEMLTENEGDIELFGEEFMVNKRKRVDDLKSQIKQIFESIKSL